MVASFEPGARIVCVDPDSPRMSKRATVVRLEGESDHTMVVRIDGESRDRRVERDGWERAKPGRPRSAEPVAPRITLQLDPDVDEALDAEAERLGLDRGAVARRWLRTGAGLPARYRPEE